MRVASLPTPLLAAVDELQRLYEENSEVVDDVVRFLKERHHTARVTLRFHGGVLQCAELERISHPKKKGPSQGPTNGSAM